MKSHTHWTQVLQMVVRRFLQTLCGILFLLLTLYGWSYLSPKFDFLIGHDPLNFIYRLATSAIEPNISGRQKLEFSDQELSLKANELRKKDAARLLDQQPNLYRREFGEALLSGRVEIGMNPLEAQIASGRVLYYSNQSKKDDPNHTERDVHTGTLHYIAPFSLEPLTTVKMMTLKSNTQYSEAGLVVFNVYFN